MAINTITPTVYTTSVLIGDTTDIPINNSDPVMTKSGANVVSAALEIQSTKGGLLPPRMTTAQRDALTIVDGMQIYNSTTGQMNFRENGVWVPVGSGTGDVVGPVSSVIGNIPRWADTGGTLLDDSGVLLVFRHTSSIGIGPGVMGAGTGIDNILIGENSGAAMTLAEKNVGIGTNTFLLLTEDTDNVAIGENAATLQVNYNRCTFLGSNSDALVDELTNATAIGAFAHVSVDNGFVLGGTGASAVNVGIGTTSPVNRFHLVGTFRQKGIESGWTGSDSVKGQASIQTTDDTPTTILTVPVPTSIDTAVFLNVNILAMRTNGQEAGYTQNVYAAAYYNGTTTASIGTLFDISFIVTSLFTIDAQFVVSGNNLLLQVVGIAAKTINWVCEYDYYAVNTSTA